MHFKQLKTITVIFSLLVLISSKSFSADYGIGISASEFDSSILFPIKISDHFKTEFLIQYSDRDSDNDINWESISSGIGFFYVNEVYDKTQLYIGPRFL
jgi:hypothetical protein